MPRIGPANVQGLIFNLYRYPVSRHLLFRVTDAAGARVFLRTLLPQITHAAVDLASRPEPLINIGITWTGLLALGVFASAEALASATTAFPAEYRSPPPGSLSGDWKGRFKSTDVHLTIHLYCMSDARLDEVTRDVRSRAAHGFAELTPAAGADPAITGKSLGGARLHFGFIDGISQPKIKWDDDAPNEADLIDFRHFILGYWSEDVQSFPRAGPWADLVRDGSYGAFQWVYQDVATFEFFLTANARKLASGLPMADARELLAAKMMGRWRNGTPVALSPDRQDDSLATATKFGYANDPKGARCPVTAHVRIANRRDQELNTIVAANFPTGGPHLLRRGMAYGPELTTGEDDGVDRGLVGVFLCSNLRNQFFIIMNWINKTDFSPVFDPARLRWQDMLMGDRSTTGAVARGAIPMPIGEVLLEGLPQFIKAQGTLLLLYLGMTGIAQIAQEPS
jgi:Dyp-type peroxidase family